MKWERLRRRRSGLAAACEDQQKRPLKNVITIAAGTLALSVATRAALAAPPEYNRGYNDCLAGRYDEGEAQYSHSYR